MSGGRATEPSEDDAVQGDLLDPTAFHRAPIARDWELLEPDDVESEAATSAGGDPSQLALLPTPPPPAPAPRDPVAEAVAAGTELGALGRYDEAERELRRAQRTAPDDPSVRAGLGILSFRRGLYAQAESELAWVCTHAPDHGPAHLYRGEALNRLGRVDEALATLERAAVLQPDNYRAYYLMGILFDRKSLREQAGEMYRRARELQPR